MKFSGLLCNDTRNNWLHFWGNLDHHADSPNWESGKSIGVISCLGQGGLHWLSALVNFEFGRSGNWSYLKSLTITSVTDRGSIGKSMVRHNTKYPYWNQVSLITQTKPSVPVFLIYSMEIYHAQIQKKLDKALREHRPWPRQITTLILPM